MRKSDLLVMDEISKANGDIRMSPHFIRGQKTKNGGEVTFGVDESTLMEILNNDVYAALYVVNKKEFDAIKNDINPNSVEAQGRGTY